jgi:hypothetical protein
MSKIAVLLGLALSGIGMAKVCDQAYHMQDAFQYTLTGSSLTNLTAGAAKKLDKSMNGVTLLHDSTVYRIITDWDGKGTCDGWVKREVSYRVRTKAAKEFTPEVNSQQSIRFFDGAFTYKTPGWDEYWFGIASEMHGDTAILGEEIGKFKNQARLSLWYGAAIMKLTTRTKNGALIGTSTGYLKEVGSHPDSAKLAADLVSSWKNYAPNDTQSLDFTVELIKITYDSVPTPVTGIAKSHSNPQNFHAQQIGNMTLIQIGDKRVGTEPLSLFGMMGNKIATLHPIGYFYQWNGKTSTGADAPPGVYFVQAGNKVLGKFFYSR